MMANPISKFLDKLTGVDEVPTGEQEYNPSDYVTLDINDNQMKQLEQGKTGQILVTFHKLRSDLEYNDLVDKVRHNKIVILDIALLKNSDFTGLKMLSQKLKQKCQEMGWGLGALSNDLLMITPTSVVFEKKKKVEE
jgi:SepF-like predicted cell division protein (DUF552 family)